MLLKKLQLILFASMFSLSCDENFVIIKCQDCLDSEPTEAVISVEIGSVGEFNYTVFIYEGKIEDNILLKTDHTNAGVLEYRFPVNKTYTFKVEYTNSQGIKYSAINSIFPRVRLDTEQCDISPCYYVYDNRLNLSLKYI